MLRSSSLQNKENPASALGVKNRAHALVVVGRTNVNVAVVPRACDTNDLVSNRRAHVCMSRSYSGREGAGGSVCDKPGTINLHDGFTVGPRYDYCYYMIIAIITRRQSVRGFLLPFFFYSETRYRRRTVFDF